MACVKRKRESFAEATYRPSHNKSTDLQTANRRTSRGSIVSTQAPAVSDVEKRDVNGSSDEVDETIATLKLAAESVTVRVLRETADEQARVIQVMRSTIDAKDLKIQKLYRKIERRDKRVGKLSKRVEREDFALVEQAWLKPEALMKVETTRHQNMKVLRDKRSAFSSGLCPKCGENCIRLVDENQQLKDRLHEVDGLCIRLRTECGKLESKIRELEMRK